MTLSSFIIFVAIGCISIIIFLIMSHFAIINNWYVDEEKPKKLFWSIWTASLFCAIGTQIITIVAAISNVHLVQYTFYAYLPLITGLIIVAGYMSAILVRMRNIEEN